MSKRSKPRFGTIGTVSHATMRAEDLIPAFLYTADSLRLSKADRASIARIQRSWDADFGGEDAGENDRGENMDEAVAELFDILGNYAPPFCYFGANEGDGSDYGFWPSMESLEESVRDGETLKESSNGFKTRYELGEHSADEPGILTGAWRYRMVVSDHGNVSLYHRNGTEIWGVV